MPTLRIFRVFARKEVSKLLTAFGLFGALAPFSVEAQRVRIGDVSDRLYSLNPKAPQCGILPLVAIRGTAAKPTARQVGVGWLIATSRGLRVLAPAHVVAGASLVKAFCNEREFLLKVETWTGHDDLALLVGSGKALSEIPSTPLIKFPLSQAQRSRLNKNLSWAQANSKSNFQYMGSTVAGIDFSKPAAQAPELWMSITPFLHPGEVFDLHVRSGVRPGFSGAAVLDRDSTEMFPIGMIQQTLNPGQQARGLSLSRIASVVEILLRKQKPVYEMTVQWTLKASAKGVARKRYMDIRGKKRSLRLTEACTSPIFSGVSQWGGVGGADWGDGGGADWADGGDGVVSSDATNTQIPRAEGDALRYTNVSADPSVLGIFIHIPFFYFSPQAETSRCSSVGLRVPDGRILVGIRGRISMMKTEFFPVRELEDLFQLKRAMTKNSPDNDDFIKMLEKDAVYLPASNSLLQMPACDFIEGGLWETPGGGIESNYGESKRVIGWVVGPRLLSRIKPTSEQVRLSCNKQKTEVRLVRKDFDLKWTSSGYQGWMMDGSRRINVSSRQRDLQVMRVRAGKTALNISVPSKPFGTLSIYQKLPSGQPWLKVWDLTKTDGEN